MNKIFRHKNNFQNPEQWRGQGGGGHRVHDPPLKEGKRGHSKAKAILRPMFFSFGEQLFLQRETSLFFLGLRGPG